MSPPCRRQAESAKIFEHGPVDSDFIVAPFDEKAAHVGGTIRAKLEKTGHPIGPLDTLIAARAVSPGVALVTHNLREFSRVPGLKVENWAGE